MKKPIFTAILASLAFIPAAHAAISTGVSPLDGAVRMIARIFNLPSLANNEFVQVGFLKIMFWLVLFTFTHFTFKKVFGSLKYESPNKIAGIIAFCFTTIAVVFMPKKWLLAQGGVVVVLLSSLIFLAIVGGLLYLAFFSLKGNWLQHVFGILLIILLMYIVGLWGEATGTLKATALGAPALILFPIQWMFRRKS